MKEIPLGQRSSKKEEEKERKKKKEKKEEVPVSHSVFSKRDYCNSLLSGASENLIDKLRRVQNAAARLVVL